MWSLQRADRSQKRNRYANNSSLWLPALYRAPVEIIPVGIRPPASGSGRKAWSADLSDHTRFEELVLPHLNAAYNLARWLTRDVNDAEDVVHDACGRAKTFRNRRRFSSHGPTGRTGAVIAWKAGRSR